MVTRRNDRRVRTDLGMTVKNRDYWTITVIDDDKSIIVTGPTGTARLPADYASQHVELGYAQTSHATQGRTVDTALLLVDTPTDSRSIYTPLTRGRHSNHAYIALADNQTPKTYSRKPSRETGSIGPHTPAEANSTNKNGERLASHSNPRPTSRW